MIRYIIAILILSCFSKTVYSQESIAVDKDREAQLQFEKTFIWAFTKYIEWPEETLGEKFVIATYNFSELTPFLIELKDRYETAKELSIEVYKLDDSMTLNKRQSLSEIDMIISSSFKDERILRKSLKSNLEKESGDLGIVFICENCTDYAMINFIEVDKKIKFEIKAESMKSEGFQVSSVLSDLAIEKE